MSTALSTCTTWAISRSRPVSPSRCSTSTGSEVTYADVGALMRDLRATGAVNVAGGRRRTLTGRQRWRGFEAELQQRQERFAVTVELILGQAWGRGPPNGRGEILVPVDRIGRRAETT